MPSGLLNPAMFLLRLGHKLESRMLNPFRAQSDNAHGMADFTESNMALATHIALMICHATNRFSQVSPSSRVLARETVILEAPFWGFWHLDETVPNFGGSCPL